jgi:hypothetical protein
MIEWVDLNCGREERVRYVMERARPMRARRREGYWMNHCPEKQSKG